MLIFRTKYKNVTVNFLPDTRIQNLFPLTFKVIDGFNLPGYRMDIQSKYNHRYFKCSATNRWNDLVESVRTINDFKDFNDYPCISELRLTSSNYCG